VLVVAALVTCSRASEPEAPVLADPVLVAAAQPIEPGERPGDVDVIAVPSPGQVEAEGRKDWPEAAHGAFVECSDLLHRKEFDQAIATMAQLAERTGDDGVRAVAVACRAAARVNSGVYEEVRADLVEAERLVASLPAEARDDEWAMILEADLFLTIATGGRDLSDLADSATTEESDSLSDRAAPQAAPSTPLDDRVREMTKSLIAYAAKDEDPPSAIYHLLWLPIRAVGTCRGQSPGDIAGSVRLAFYALEEFPQEQQVAGRTALVQAFAGTVPGMQPSDPVIPAQPPTVVVPPQLTTTPTATTDEPPTTTADPNVIVPPPTTTAVPTTTDAVTTTEAPTTTESPPTTTERTTTTRRTTEKEQETTTKKQTTTTKRETTENQETTRKKQTTEKRETTTEKQTATEEGEGGDGGNSGEDSGNTDGDDGEG
jgi:hypothetical protein